MSTTWKFVADYQNVDLGRIARETADAGGLVAFVSWMARDGSRVEAAIVPDEHVEYCPRYAGAVRKVDENGELEQLYPDGQGPRVIICGRARALELVQEIREARSRRACVRVEVLP